MQLKHTTPKLSLYCQHKQRPLELQYRNFLELKTISVIRYLNKTMSSNLKHHKRLVYCTTRLKYRQGRSLTAVKAYTVANESQHLLIFGVPKINIQPELKRMIQRFGEIDHIRNVTLDIVKTIDLEPFTEVFWVKFSQIADARKCKRHLDAKEFYGGILHISYAPEYETQEELRDKLQRRISEVTYRQKINAKHQKIVI